MSPCPRARSSSQASPRFSTLTILLLLSPITLAERGWAVDLPWGMAQTLDGSVQDLTALVVADLDQNGADDVIGVGPGGLRWWPSSQASITIDAGTSDWTDLIVRDLDGDGDLDLAAVSPTDGLCWWQSSTGDASTWSASTIDGTVVGRGLAAADLNLDGTIDLIAGLGGAGGSVEWWSNTAGDGSSWSRAAIDASVADSSSVAVVDLDRDGDPDVVATADGATDVLAWWENLDGSAGSWTRHDVGTGLANPDALAVGDLNQDGFQDLISVGDSGLTWWLSDGSPSSGWTTGDLPAAGAVGAEPFDLDRDGDLDVVSGAGNHVLWWENDGSGASWTARTGPAVDGVGPVAVLLLDPDDDPDLLAAGFTDDDLLAWSNESIHRSLTLDREIPLDGAFDGARAVHAADLDGDGDLDVAGVAYDQGEIAWWENTGLGGSWTRHSIETGLPYAFAVRTADLDADGDLDLVASFSRLSFDVGTNRLYWWRNDGLPTAQSGSGPPAADPAAETAVGSITWTRQTVASPFGAADVWPVDMDRDGDVDLLSAAAGADEIAWYANNGSGGGWTATVIDTLFDRVHSVVGVDIDNDGDTDILAAGETADEVAWWENTSGDGSLPWSKHSIITSWDGAYDVWAADLDADGDQDVIAASQIEDRISWWENTDGEGSFGSEKTLGDPFSTSEGFFNQAYGVETADMDGDGTLDIVGAAYKDGGHLAVWRNVAGDGNTWQKFDITMTYDGAAAVHIVDLNQDGLPDLLTTAQVDDQLTFWPNGGGQVAFTTVSLAPLEPAPSAEVPILDVLVSHRGQTGESDIELVALVLRLEDGNGTPLTDTQANGLIERLRIFRDEELSGSPGTYDAGDAELAVLETLAPDAQGFQELPVADDAAAAAVAEGAPGRFFVVLDTTADYDQQPVAGLKVTHATEPSNPASSRAEDRDADTTLRTEFAEDVDSGIMVVGDLADLELTLMASTGTPTAGDMLTWTATIENLGPDAAESVVLTLAPSSDITLISTTGCTEDPTGLPTCTVGNLAASSSAQVMISAMVNADASGTQQLAGMVESATTDADMLNNGSSSEVDVTSVADLNIQVVAPAAYASGAPLSYSVWVTNSGPGPAETVVDGPLPMVLSSASWTCAAFDGAACGSASGSGALDDTPAVPSGGRIEYVITADVDGAASAPIEVTATVQAGAGSSDPSLSDNSDSATSYNAGQSIFVDGFESGDTSSW